LDIKPLMQHKPHLPQGLILAAAMRHTAAPLNKTAVTQTVMRRLWNPPKNRMIYYPTSTLMLAVSWEF